MALAAGISARKLQKDIMKDIIKKTFSRRPPDEMLMDTYKYDGRLLEEAIQKHFGSTVSNTPLSDLAKLPANKHNPNLRVAVTTI